MRTEDFSSAPGFATPGDVFYGGTHYSGIWSIIRLGFLWIRFSRALRNAPGYLGHTVWYRFPYTIGTISFWETREDLLSFARSQAHVDAVRWVLRPGVAKAAFIRFMTPRPVGHTIGAWHAEETDPANVNHRSEA